MLESYLELTDVPEWEDEYRVDLVLKNAGTFVRNQDVAFISS